MAGALVAEVAVHGKVFDKCNNKREMTYGHDDTNDDDDVA